jgi:hypothetical protein
MGRNLDPLERRGLVRLEVGETDQHQRVAHLTAAGELAIEAALPLWRKAQKRVAPLIENSAIGKLADQLAALRSSQLSLNRKEGVYLDINRGRLNMSRGRRTCMPVSLIGTGRDDWSFGNRESSLFKL